MTPRGVKVVDMRIWWESAPIEQSEYTAKKMQDKAEIPVKKVQHNKTFKSLQSKQAVAVTLLQHEKTGQQDQMKERLRRRKLELARKRREAQNDNQNQTMPCEFNSPNLSRISPDQKDESKMGFEQDETINTDMMDSSFLQNLDKLDNNGMPSDGDEDDIEKLEELAEKKEDVLEEYLDLVTQLKEEVQNEVKLQARVKGLGGAKELLKEANAQIEKLKKDGRRKLRRKLDEIAEDEDLPVVERIDQLSDKTQFTEFI